MSNGWKVKFEDNELDGEQVASFSSKHDAEAWVKIQKIQQRYDPTGFEVIDGPYYEEARKINEMFNTLGLKAEVIAESWKHEFDDKPENQWGEKWKLLDNGNGICRQIQDAVDDCQLDPSEAGPKVDSLSIASVHIVDGGNIIVSLYGGANGGEIPGQCNFKLYLALVKKLVAKLLDSGMFEDAWLVDWENDCLDDTYALRFVLKPNEKTLQAIKEKGMLDFLNESDSAQQNGCKIWVDDIRPAPKGYTWLKSVNDFINFVYDIHDRDGSLEAIQVIDLDHDAGDYQADGGDYIRCLDFLESFGAEDMNIRIHSANPVGVKNMRAIIRRNGWNEVHDIIEEDEAEVVNEVEKSQTMKATEKNTKGKDNSKPKVAQEVKDYAASRDSIVKALKKASAQFQKAATNNDPEQFSKIVVAFDDLAAGVGSYDFKKKEVLKEDDTEGEELETEDEPDFTVLMNAINDAGANCTDVELAPDGQHMTVHGDFTVDQPNQCDLDSLHFYWYVPTLPEEAGDRPRWCEGTKCRNKWREVVAEILNTMYPDGNAAKKEGTQDGN